MTPNMVTMVGVKTPLKVDSFGDADMCTGGYDFVSCLRYCATRLIVSFGGAFVEHIEVWQTSLTKTELTHQLRSLTEPVEEFRLVSRLSGAGIVVRSLDMPTTDKPLIGRVSDKEIVIAQTLELINISPYQPIIRIVSHGSTVELNFRPHSDVYLMSPLEWLGGFVCISSGLVGLTQNPLAILAILLGIAIVALPRYRARWNFARELTRAKNSLNELPIDWSMPIE